jgi:hypothetical protein
MYAKIPEPQPKPHSPKCENSGKLLPPTRSKNRKLPVNAKIYHYD